MCMAFKFCWEEKNCSHSCTVRDDGDIFCWRSRPARELDTLQPCESCEYRLRWVNGAYTIDEFVESGDRRGAPRTTRKVLVIDDDPSILFAFEETVRLLGHDCISAGDGEEGLVLVKGARPDLVITDIVLPRVDGLDLFRRLRDNPGTSEIPVIIVTARNRKHDREFCRDLGAEAFLLKPFSLAVLTEHIERALAATAPAAGVASPGYA